MLDVHVYGRLDLTSHIHVHVYGRLDVHVYGRLYTYMEG